MLEAARAQQKDGVDVVIGWVETHGRAETAALAEGFERLPPREVEYRGVLLKEFDLDAALARRPGLLLLDELAHTNAPGARHPKRWQDARELLAAGIDVYTTLNVQHLESLNDLVERITGVVVRETLPDRLLDEADEVEFVDLPPDELLRRLGEGKVYLPDQAAHAVKELLPQGQPDWRCASWRCGAPPSTWTPTCRTIGATTRSRPPGRSPSGSSSASGRTPRAAGWCARPAASRRASRAEWIVACVETPAQPPLSTQERAHLAAAFELAEQLGAETASVSGASVPEARAARSPASATSARSWSASRRRSRRGLWRGSLVDDIVRCSGDIDVFIVTGDEDAPARAHRAGAPLAAARVRGGRAGGARRQLPVAGRCWAASTSSNMAMVYLLGVVFVATRHGRGPSAFAAVLSVAVFDFFFVPPHLTFAVSDTQYLISFAVMLVVGLLVSTLAARVRDAAEFAAEARAPDALALRAEPRAGRPARPARDRGGRRAPRARPAALPGRGAPAGARPRSRAGGRGRARLRARPARARGGAVGVRPQERCGRRTPTRSPPARCSTCRSSLATNAWASWASRSRRRCARCRRTSASC